MSSCSNRGKVPKTLQIVLSEALNIGQVGYGDGGDKSTLSVVGAWGSKDGAGIGSPRWVDLEPVVGQERFEAGGKRFPIFEGVVSVEQPVDVQSISAANE
jgi:hypothetical protein